MYNQVYGNYETGLATCLPYGTLNSYCILKGTEFSLSLLLFILCFLEIYKQTRFYGFELGWKTISLILMITSLAINMAFCIWNTTYQLFSVLSYMNNMYFLIIVGYVCRMYIVKNNLENKRLVHYSFIGCFVVMTIFYTSIMVDSLINETNQEIVNNACQQIWYLCINVICLFLCMIALVVLYVNQKEEQKKMSIFQINPVNINNPLFSLWVWIGLNTISQVIDLIQTGLLLNVTQGQSCMIIQGSQNANNFLMFFFAITTMMVGYAATLWYYAAGRNKISKLHSAIIRSSQNIETQNIDYYNSQKFHAVTGYSEQIKFGHGLQMMDSLSESFEL